MVVGAEVCHRNIPVLDVQFNRCITKGNNIQKIEEMVEISSPKPVLRGIHTSATVSVEASLAELDLRDCNSISDTSVDMGVLQFIPTIRSGSFSDIGPVRCMEDEHIRIDDLAMHLGSMFRCPMPSAFYGVFDGHGGPDASAFMRKNALRFFFHDTDFPQALVADDTFIEGMENSVREAFLTADLALGSDCSISSSSGTTVLTALIFGRLLLVANAGDCRAVLCRKGEAVDMSHDHKPLSPSERQRVESCNASVDDGGYLNGLLGVTRALGDWDIKGSPTAASTSPLIAEPEFRRTLLSEDDEFLIMGCDGIWDVMTSEKAVGIVRRGLRRHNDPERCARELVMEALRLHTFDNLTVIVVCFSSPSSIGPGASSFCEHSRPRLLCSLSPEALRKLRSLLCDQ
ncbi:probable protein phosphatase 2C 47 [Amborella trichopoda]|uniref:protein-serine/threonine phosphatase n=1 Tax=Amborella trichopoda TaxID=13333 RepID=W1P6G6_AMBTC|nr:probable protein phosphatase 2C 47 [Amborella trichopoda]ERN03254.1 hypothetical protein AMTR_s00003p00195190 [Amborella trichopoda]|eukprot:XP_006841579.1 probable protein phosphatase 2C 47 [Amborella trichopoda]